MKKIVALVLAFVMMVAAAVPAFAADREVSAAEHYPADPNKKLTGDGEEGGNTGTVEVNYEVSAKWQILIPADVVFVDVHGLRFLADVEAQQARIPVGQTLTLTVSSENGYKMKNIENDRTDAVPYSVSFVENNVMPGSEPPVAMVGEWPELSAEVLNDREARAEAYGNHFAVDPYKTAAGDSTQLLSVIGNGNTIPRVTTTMAFYTVGTDTIGTYKDVLTFTALLTGEAAS